MCNSRQVKWVFIRCVVFAIHPIGYPGRRPGDKGWRVNLFEVVSQHNEGLDQLQVIVFVAQSGRSIHKSKPSQVSQLVLIVFGNREGETNSIVSNPTIT